MKRVVIPELLDTDSGTPEEIADSLLDLQAINRKFGGVTTLQSMVERISTETGITSFSLLEVAAGAGYVPDIVRARLQNRGIHLQITLLDRARSHLPKNNGSAHNPSIVGDALALPFQAASYDLVDCSLFAHHLSPEELVRFVNEALRVSRVAVLINDIVRHPLHLALVYAAQPVFRSRITRHDARVSIRRAYTEAEIAELLRQTNAARIEIQRHYLFRIGAIAWKSK